MLGTGETVIEELVDAGDRVVCRFRVRLHGRQSAIEVEFPFSQVRTFRRGKTIMVEFFLDHQAALEAAGHRVAGVEPAAKGGHQLRGLSNVHDVDLHTLADQREQVGEGLVEVIGAIVADCLLSLGAGYYGPAAA
jgi:hypothetical protein